MKSLIRDIKLYQLGISENDYFKSLNSLLEMNIYNIPNKPVHIHYYGYGPNEIQMIVYYFGNELSKDIYINDNIYKNTCDSINSSINLDEFRIITKEFIKSNFDFGKFDIFIFENGRIPFSIKQSLKLLKISDDTIN